MLALPLNAACLLGISRPNIHLRQLRGGIHSKQLRLPQLQTERLNRQGTNQVQSCIGALFFGVGLVGRARVLARRDDVGNLKGVLTALIKAGESASGTEGSRGSDVAQVWNRKGSTIRRLCRTGGDPVMAWVVTSWLALPAKWCNRERSYRTLGSLACSSPS
jgi:hypothetical protein